MQSLRSLGKRSLLLISMARGVRFGVHHYRTEKLSKKRRLERTAVFQSYLQSRAVRKLQIGTQENILPGWLNTDLLPVDGRVVFLDAREPFPFEDGTLDYIFCEHCIEHITYAEGLSALPNRRAVASRSFSKSILKRNRVPGVPRVPRVPRVLVPKVI